jgi:hypothetical protein
MPYRDDVEALEHRCNALEAEAAGLERELGAARRLLEEARAERRLPVVDDVRVAAPCPADWDSMVGDARVRFCGACARNVYNLSAMTRAEAQALLVEKEGRLCVRYFQRTDGTLLTADCPVGIRRRRRRRRVVAAAALVASAAAMAAGGVVHSQRALREARRQAEEALSAGALPEARTEGHHVTGVVVRVDAAEPR